MEEELVVMEEEEGMQDEEDEEEENWRVFDGVLKKIRNLVKKFSTSVLGKAELAKHTKLAIIKDCPTRWWSTLDQVQRINDIYKENSNAIREVCSVREWSLTLDLKEEDLKMVELFLEFFGEMKVKSDCLGGEKSSNIHLVYIYCKELRSHIESYIDHQVLGEFSQKFLNFFTIQFDFILNQHHDPNCEECKFQPLFLATTILSPVYINFLTDEEKTLGFKTLLSELRKIETPIVRQTNVARKKTEFHGLKHLSKNLSSKDPASRGDDVEKKFMNDKQILMHDSEVTLDEIQATDNEAFIMSEDPMNYWINNAHKYSSALPKLATNLLAATPSSVPSERLFSIASFLSAGIWIEYFFLCLKIDFVGRRNSLTSKNLERRVLLYLNKNLI